MACSSDGKRVIRSRPSGRVVRWTKPRTSGEVATRRAAARRRNDFLLHRGALRQAVRRRDATFIIITSLRWESFRVDEHDDDDTMMKKSPLSSLPPLPVVTSRRPTSAECGASSEGFERANGKISELRLHRISSRDVEQGFEGARALFGASQFIAPVGWVSRRCCLPPSHFTRELVACRDGRAAARSKEKNAVSPVSLVGGRPERNEGTGGTERAVESGGGFVHLFAPFRQLVAVGSRGAHTLTHTHTEARRALLEDRSFSGNSSLSSRRRERKGVPTKFRRHTPRP